MEKVVLNVNGMSCGHCVRAVTGALSGLPGVGEVTVDLEAKTVTLDLDPSQTPLSKIKEAIEDEGYDIAP